jgi:hypothetical protein
MGGSRKFRVETRTALAALSKGTCYWPACPTPIVTLANGKYRTNLQIAHIWAARREGRGTTNRSCATSATKLDLSLQASP